MSYMVYIHLIMVKHPCEMFQLEGYCENISRSVLL